jgi:hypothetical protein
MEKITITLCLDKIDEAHAWDYNEKRYISVTLVPTPDNQYGKDYMVKQYWKDETLPAGKYPDHPILGNGKVMRASSATPAGSTKPNDDAPF